MIIGVYSAVNIVVITILQTAHHVIYMQFVSLRFNSILGLNDALRGPTQGFVPRAG